jgi:hypothetical protein
MKSSKIKTSLLKSLPITAGNFIVCIVLFSIGSIIDGTLIDPVDVLKLFGLFVAIGMVNYFRFYIDGSRWSMSKPSVLKNIIFAPIYLLLAMVFIVWITGTGDVKTLAMVGAIFIVVFTVMQVIAYFIEKIKTDEMNDALKQFLKEHEEDEEE